MNQHDVYVYRLNQLGEKWASIPESDNVLRLNTREEILSLTLYLFDAAFFDNLCQDMESGVFNPEKAILSILTGKGNALDRFDHTRSKLYDYFNIVLSYTVLNQLGDQWYAIQDDKDRRSIELKRRIANDIGRQAERVFDKKYFNRMMAKKDLHLSTGFEPSLAIDEFFGYRFMSFNPSKGTLHAYMNSVMQSCAIDADSKDRQKPDAESKKKSKQCKHSSLDSSYPVSLDGMKDAAGNSREAQIEDRCFNPEYILESNGRIEMLISELTASILNFSARHSGKQDNEIRRFWYRLFYTEDMTLAWKKINLHVQHERDIFNALCQHYLDYYMTAPCRTGDEVCLTPLKPYGDVVEDSPNRRKETPVPIPADVSIGFIHRTTTGITATRPTRSNFHSDYKKEKEEIKRGVYEQKTKK